MTNFQTLFANIHINIITNTNANLYLVLAILNARGHAWRKPDICRGAAVDRVQFPVSLLLISNVSTKLIPNLWSQPNDQTFNFLL